MIVVALAISIRRPLIAGPSERTPKIADVEVLPEKNFESWRRGANDGNIGFNHSPRPGVVRDPSDIVRLEEYFVDIQTADDARNTEAEKD